MSSTEPSAVVPCRLDRALSVAGARTRRPWAAGRTASLRLDVSDADLQTIWSELGAEIKRVERARRSPCAAEFRDSLHPFTQTMY